MSSPTESLGVVGELLRRDRVVQLSAGVFALSLAVLILQWLDPQGPAGRAAVLVDPLLLATTLAVLLWNRRRLDTARERRFWDLIAAGWACWLMVEFLFFTGFALPFISASFAADTLYVLYYLVLALAVDLKPHIAPSPSLGTARRRLESVAALAAFFGVLVYFALVVAPEPLGLSLSFVERERGLVPFLLFRLSLDLFLLARLLRGSLVAKGRWTDSYRLLAAAMLLLAVRDGATLLYYAEVLSLDSIRLGFDLVVCLPGFLVILAARRRALHGAAMTTVLPAPRERLQLARPSLVAIYALIVPFAHLLLYPLGLLEEESRGARDVFCLIYLLAIGSIAAIHHFLLDKERRQAIDSLHDEIDERELINRQLALRQAEAEQFSYTISHELQAPLVTIGGFVGLLQTGLENGDRAQMEQDLLRIRAATGHMRQVLQELLDLSRVGWRVEPKDDLSMTELAETARDRLEGKIESRDPRIDIENDLPTVRADPERIVNVLANLIDNAVKFTPPDRRPEIRIGCRGDEAVFYVADNGRGVDPHFREKIFRLFDRLDPAVEGTGVGLALVKRIVEEHGGRVWVESQGVGRGSTFCFTLGEPKTPT